MVYKRLYDLHVHLDGSLSFDMARKLAKVQGMEEKTDEELKGLMVVPEDCRDLNDYLTKFEYPLTLLQTEESLITSVYDLLSIQGTQGLKYSEIRFAPQLHMQKGLNQEQVVAAAVKGLQQFRQEQGDDGMKAGLILCCMRGDTNEKENIQTVEVAGDFLGKGVVALDLAGAEALYPTENFEALFRMADKANIPFTIHAGEAAGPISIWKALEFGAKRIGHGVRCIEDEILMRRLAKDKVVLELCPTSNMNTKIFSSIKDYPLQRLLDADIKATINTDNRTVSAVTVKEEMDLMVKTFGLSSAEIEQLLKNSEYGAFLK